jgi:hypothetical protein
MSTDQYLLELKEKITAKADKVLSTKLSNED